MSTKALVLAPLVAKASPFIVMVTDLPVAGAGEAISPEGLVLGDANTDVADATVVLVLSAVRLVLAALFAKAFGDMVAGGAMTPAVI